MKVNGKLTCALFCAVCLVVPDKFVQAVPQEVKFQSVRYYGWYFNKARGMRLSELTLH